MLYMAKEHHYSLTNMTAIFHNRLLLIQNWMTQSIKNNSSINTEGKSTTQIRQDAGWHLMSFPVTLIILVVNSRICSALET